LEIIAYKLFSIKRRFYRSKYRPSTFKKSSIRERQIWVATSKPTIILLHVVHLFRKLQYHCCRMSREQLSIAQITCNLI